MRRSCNRIRRPIDDARWRLRIPRYAAMQSASSFRRRMLLPIAQVATSVDNEAATFRSGTRAPSNPYAKLGTARFENPASLRITQSHTVSAVGPAR